MQPIGTRKKFLDKIESTHAYLVDKIVSDVPPQHGDVIVTSFQKAGHGMAKNHWESEAGKNLLVSFFLQPDKLDADKQFYLNMAVSLSILHTVKYFLESKRISIKWPNDIYVEEKKIAGILISHTVMGSQIEHSVVSVGLNVNQQEFFSDAPNPISLINHLDSEIEIDNCLNVLIEEMDRYYSLFVSDQWSNLYQEYIAVLYGFKQWREYLYEAKQIRAKILKVLSCGQLELETETGQILKCNFKEIEFVI